MNIAKFSKWAIFTALIVAGSMGAPHQAQAAGGGDGGGGGHIVVFDIVDSSHDDQSAIDGGDSQDTVVDSVSDETGKAEASSYQPDPEYKYVPVRR